MQAGGASLRSILGLDDETAVAALPPNLTVAVEEVAIRQAAQQLQVAALMLGLDLGNVAECGSYGGEALLVGYGSKSGVEHIPLLVLALSSGQQVLLRRADLTGGVGGRNLQIATLEKLEETLGVLLLLLGRLHKEARNLLVALLLGYRCEDRIAGASLALTGKCFEQILLSLGTFQTLFHGYCL